MLRYQKIDVSDGINVNKTSASKECELCHYWLFKDIGFKFQEHVCNKCHDLFQMSGYIKYFENGSKNMSFLIKDNKVW